MKRKQLEQSGLMALQLLRKSKLEQGHPFMINSGKLPLGQCYLEFPNGTIQLVTLTPAKMDFEVIRELSSKEQSSLRKALQLA